MLELQNDDIYELVIDNSYFIFIGNDSFNEEIDYFREVSAQQPFSIITDSDNQYSKFGEVLLSADTKSNKDAFINDAIERISKVDNIFIFSDMSTDEVAKETANICELSKDKQTILIIKPNAILDENTATNISEHANITILSQVRDKSFNIFKVTYLAISHILRACLETSAFIVTRRHVDKKRLCAAAKTREDCQTVPQRSDGQRMGACTSSPAPCFWRRSEAQNRPA